MKKVLFLTLVLVVALGAVAMAKSASDSFDVKLNILHYVELVLPDSLNLEDINFADGYGRRLSTTMKLYTNDDVYVRLESAGFVDAEGNESPTLNQWVQYSWTPGTGHPFFLGAGKSVGGWGPYGYDFTGSVIDMPLKVIFKAPKADWFAARAGDYSDVITVTVFAK